MNGRTMGEILDRQLMIACNQARDFNIEYSASEVNKEMEETLIHDGKHPDGLESIILCH